VKQVGTRRRAIDWDARTAGRVAYSGDVRLEGLLDGAILRSPHPHARIRSIDIARARAMRGVHAVITAADLPRGARYLHEGAGDRPPLADAIVRFIGQEVAAVAAETPAQAQLALRAIDVVYETLPAPLSVGDALAPGAARLHERPTTMTNVSFAVKRDWGTIEAGKRQSTAAVDGKFLFPRQAHACMETNIAVASWDAAEQCLHFWTSTQSPHYVVQEVAHVLGLEPRQVVCHEVGVGGGFGAKSKICEHEAIAGALAIAAGRPVRLRLSREEEFETTKTRHAFDVAMRLHADAAGQLRAIEATLTVENGAYNHSGVSVMGAGIKALGMLYRPDGVVAEGRLVDTAITPGGQFRGYGSTQASFALECLMDELAEKLDLDPIELRLRNANQAGETTLVGARLGSARLVECLEAAREAIGWKGQKADRRSGRGVGIAAGVHVSGSFTAPGANRSDAAIDILPDSRVRVRFGGSDAGTGQKTILAQIAAEELGVELDSVEVLTMDSRRTPFDMGAWSSRGTHFGGNAVRKAALETAARLQALAATKLGGELRLEGGAVHGDQGAIPIGELARLSNDAVDGVLSTESSFVEQTIEMADRATGKGNVSASYNFAAHAAVVEVDLRTGRVTLVDYVAAHDIGTAINPTFVESQAIGGAAMGIGLALGEEVIHEQGKMVNGSYLHYALPRAADLPRIRPILIEGGDPLGPYGAKAIGECGINPPASAIANAIYDAIGVRLRDPPFTPDKILVALAARDGRHRDHALWRRPGRWWIALVRWAYPRFLLKLLHARTAPPEIRVDPAPIEEVATPATLGEAFEACDERSMLVGGGTDLQIRRRQRLVEPRRLVSLRRVAELQGVTTLPDGTIEIAAATTLAALAGSMRGRLSLLEAAIECIATPQIREMATVGGNLVQEKRCWFYRNGFGCYKRLGGLAPCYAVAGDHRFYHAAIDGHRCQATTPSDLATALIALDATVEIVAPAGRRLVTMSSFYSGPGETVLGPRDVLRAIHLPASSLARTGAFAKLRLWEGDFAVVSAAVTSLAGEGGRWRDPRIVLGAVAPTPWRAVATERQLEGTEVSATGLQKVLDRELDAKAHPLARNGWKLDAAVGIAEEAVERMCAGRDMA
jgi:CO/xanthine dehydrogenase Mo-binding subunit/CO/xanthine dehydrogenase FAD-binding subunit